MKYLAPLFLFFFNVSSAQADWENVANCDGGMFVIDRQVGESGRFEYQAVFRRNVVHSMLEQHVAGSNEVNEVDEIIRDVSTSISTPIQAAGMISKSIGFTFGNTFDKSPHYSLIFHERGSIRGKYVFNYCWFKYPIL